MRKILFDTSVYIDALRRQDASRLLARGGGEALWLSAVVLEELLAGSDERVAKLLGRLERDFERAKRLLVPQQSDWTVASRILARFGSKYGFETIGRARLTNDVLIAASSARLSVAVATLNTRDFARIGEFFPSFQWEVIT